MKAFVIRPFGTKNDIDFDNVHKRLIAPVLTGLGIQGGTTAPFMQAGNIREDMFQQLLVADIIIADISIHNANVFYELGIRHALQPMRTFLLRARVKSAPKPKGGKTPPKAPQDAVPFDLLTDRYLDYDPTKPEKSQLALTDALKQTLANEKSDSPVFRMLPDLKGQDRSHFLPIPSDFRDDVELAFKAKRVGLLGLLAAEARGFFWASEGVRIVARAQFNLKAHRDAKESWEFLQKLNPLEPEANQRLGTIYQRLGDLDASDQALKRVLDNKNVSRPDRAEAFSLFARNIKDRWRTSWKNLPSDAAPAAALKSPKLFESYETYRQGFQENLDSFYAGLNALSLLTLHLELAKQRPTDWSGRFPTPEDAEREFARLEVERQKLAGAVSLSLEARKDVLKREGRVDEWVDISAADYLFLTNSNPGQITFAYDQALPQTADFNFASARDQLELFRALGVLKDRTEAALSAFRTPQKIDEPAPSRVILFTGHMIDDAQTAPPRFPDSLRDAARLAIRDKLQQEVARTKGIVVAIASGASGGDLLFHDICDELKIEHRLYLPLPRDLFRTESVTPSGRYWQDQFDKLYNSYKTPPPNLAQSAELPSWLSTVNGYTTWQRANVWLIYEALAIGAAEFTLLSLWDGVKKEGLGGTYHMRTVAEQRGAALIDVPISDIWPAPSPVASKPSMTAKPKPTAKKTRTSKPNARKTGRGDK